LLYEEEGGEISLALVGDAFITRKLSAHREPRFIGVADLLRSADVAIANAEVMFHRYEGAPIADAGLYGTYAASDPDLIDELRWLGIKMVACANNHAGDYGETGVLKNIENLDLHSMPHAGTGRTLAEAAAPVYLETPQGRVALISVTCTEPSGKQRAGDPLGPIKGRAGANELRHRITYTLPTDEFDRLRELGARLSIPNRSQSADELTFLGQRFIMGVDYKREAIADANDLELNLHWVRDARRMADWVIVSMHCHERGDTAGELPEFARDFARACIDAGADVIHGHGPHQDRAIEIYKGRPIFHALGNFIMENDLVRWEPRDAYIRLGLDPESTPAQMYDQRTGNDTRGAVTQSFQWQTAVATVSFCGRQLSEIRLHPLDLGMSSGRRSQRGRPMLAEGVVAEEVLARFQEYSAPKGTKIEVVDGRGVIRSD
jgi:Bacterial capsule synthesis protein PGA_cap